MWLVILVLHLWLFGAQENVEAQEAPGGACVTHDTYRPPEDSDITVICSTEYMELSIYICPIYQSLYNESLVALNGEFAKQGCHGIPDYNANPPVLRFKVSINDSADSFCNSKTMITSEVGTGIFSDFSKIQFVNIWGFVNSLDPSLGIITYREQLMYKFSCLYPLQYLVNNTKLGVSGVSLAVTDNNGSFISTLSMTLYKDSSYSTPLVVPERGLSLKTRIFVGVKATNLTDRFNVLLDRCFATTSAIPANSTFYDLFVGCDRDGQTKLESNGVSQIAHFSFEAFRFVEHKNKSISTFYLHCVTRLCEVDKCLDIMPICGRRRRRNEDESQDSRPASSDKAVISAGPIITRSDETPATNSQLAGSNNSYLPINPATSALISGVAILGGISLIFFLFSLRLLLRSRPPTMTSSGVWNPSYK
ncbi:unnamed protein product [Merluccius merluccius]